VLVGQELSERVGELHRRRLDRLEAVAFVDGADLLHPLPRRVRRGGGTGRPDRAAGGLEVFAVFSVCRPWSALVPADARCGNRAYFPLHLPLKRGGRFALSAQTGRGSCVSTSSCACGWSA